MHTRSFAFAGQMGSGKDTAANFLKDYSEQKKLSVKNYMFAQHLKQIAVDVFGCTEEEAFGDKKEEPFATGPKEFNTVVADNIYSWVYMRNGSYTQDCRDAMFSLVNKLEVPSFDTPRKLLQFVGTEVLRDCFTPDYHLRQVEYQIETDEPDVAIITDARFQNERDWARNFGASLVLISGRERENFESFGKHASETGLGDYSEYDFVVGNSGTLEDLKNNVVAACRNLLP